MPDVGDDVQVINAGKYNVVCTESGTQVGDEVIVKNNCAFTSGNPQVGDTVATIKCGDRIVGILSSIGGDYYLPAENSPIILSNTEYVMNIIYHPDNYFIVIDDWWDIQKYDLSFNYIETLYVSSGYSIGDLCVDEDNNIVFVEYYSIKKMDINGNISAYQNLNDAMRITTDGNKYYCITNDEYVTVLDNNLNIIIDKYLDYYMYDIEYYNNRIYIKGYDTFNTYDTDINLIDSKDCTYFDGIVPISYPYIPVFTISNNNIYFKDTDNAQIIVTDLDLNVLSIFGTEIYENYGGVGWREFCFTIFDDKIYIPNGYYLSIFEKSHEPPHVVLNNEYFEFSYRNTVYKDSSHIYNSYYDYINKYEYTRGESLELVNSYDISPYTPGILFYGNNKLYNLYETELTTFNDSCNPLSTTTLDYLFSMPPSLSSYYATEIYNPRDRDKIDRIRLDSEENIYCYRYDVSIACNVLPPDYNPPSIMKLDSDGNYIGDYLVGTANNCFTVDDIGKLYIRDGNSLKIYDSDTFNLLYTYNVGSSFHDITIDTNYNIYIAHDDYISKVSGPPHFTVIDTSSSIGGGIQFQFIRYVNGYIFVKANDNNLYKYTLDLEYVSSMDYSTGIIGQATDVYATNTNILKWAPTNNRMYVYDVDFQYVKFLYFDSLYFAIASSQDHTYMYHTFSRNNYNYGCPVFAIYIVIYPGFRIYKFDNNNYPPNFSSVAVNTDDYIYASTPYNYGINNVIIKYNSDGTINNYVDTDASTPYMQLYNNYIYVGAFDFIKIYDTDLNLVNTIYITDVTGAEEEEGSIVGMYIDDDYIYFGEWYTGKIYKCTLDGEYVSEFGLSGNSIPYFYIYNLDMLKIDSDKLIILNMDNDDNTTAVEYNDF